MDKKKRKIYRDSRSGEIVTKEFALANKEITQSETIWINPKPKVEFTAEGEENKNTEK